MNISLLRNSALVHTHKLCVAKEKRVSSIDKEVYLIIRRFQCEGLHKSRLRRRTHLAHAAAARSSLSVPRATIFDASSGKGRCNAFASSQGARIQTSHSSAVVKITGIAFEWIGSTTAFGVVVRKP
jgi:hypothetical protein